MHIDGNRKWDVHINYMLPTISANIGILWYFRKIVPMNTLKLLYNTIVLAQLDHADILYDIACDINTY